MTTENNETTNDESQDQWDTLACLVGGRLHATISRRGTPSTASQICQLSAYIAMNGLSTTTQEDE
jgi:hypothetical protein